MIIKLNVKNNNIFDFQIFKVEEFDKLTTLVAKVQYILRFYMLYLFEICMKNNNEENLNSLKECVSLIRKYSNLHKQFMLAREESKDKEIFNNMLKNNPEKILDESLWK